MGQKRLPTIVVSLILGYAAASAQHYFTREALRREVTNAQEDAQQLKGGREAIERRANRLEAQVYVSQALESLERGDSGAAQRYLSNAAVFFENGALKGNPDHEKIQQKLATSQGPLSSERLTALRNALARLTPPLSAIGGGASQ